MASKTVDFKNLFLENRTHLLSGSPGSGKTIFSIQFLLDGIAQNMNVTYISTIERLKDIIEGLRHIGIPLQEYVESEKFLAYTILMYKDLIELPSKPIVDTVRELIRQHIIQTCLKYSVKRLVIDTLDGLLPRTLPLETRVDICRLVMDELKDNNITFLATTSRLLGDLLSEYFDIHYEIITRREKNKLFKAICSLSIKMIVEMLSSRDYFYYFF